jgi:hypothetical protein
MKSALVYRINAYFAVLLITIAGAGGTLLIVHAANTAYEQEFIPQTNF